jgi:hypothetical protein
MTDDDRKEAWRRRCSQLVALGIDAYTPHVSPDDSRHLQVQAILDEYKVAIGDIVSVPPGWEGNPPIRTINTLPAFADWLIDQWTSTFATEMGGDAYKMNALQQTTRAVRNGFRVLAWLGVEDRPERPLPAETLAIAKQQFDDLERWVRNKVKDGWAPPKPSQPDEAGLATTGKRRRRAEIPDKYEINIRLKQYLDKNPRATIREIAEVVDLSTGKVSQMDAWRREMARRKAAKEPAQRDARPLTDSMLAAMGREDDPATKMVMKDEAIWQWVLETAKPNERAGLHMKTAEERAKLVELVREQYDEEHTDSDD